MRRFLLQMIFQAAVCAAALALLTPARAAAAPRLADVLAGRNPGDLMAGAEAVADPAGSPPAAAIKRGEEVLGYAVLTSDWTASIGYSGKPITILLVLDREGVARHIELIEHHEPIVLIGVPEARIRKVLQGYVGRNLVREQIEETGADKLDIVAGATVTIMVIDDALHRTAVKLAREKGLAGLSAVAAAAGPRYRIKSPSFA